MLIEEKVKLASYAERSIGFEEFRSCPLEFQQQVKRIMAIQAYAELCGANEVALHLRHAPNYRARKALGRIVYDEATHAYMLYEILEKIGVSEQEAISIVIGKSNRKRTESLEGVIAVGNEENEWVDLILNNMLMDRAGGYMVDNFSHCSFTPWAEACEKIFADEQFHKLFGLREFEKYIKKNDLKYIKERFSIWYLHALNFFGPPVGKSQETLYAFGIKKKSNDELRDSFIEEVSSILCGLDLIDFIPNDISTTYPYFLQKREGDN